MTLSLFNTTPSPADNLAEIKSRIHLLDIERVFIEPSGTNITSRILYTLPINCEHEVFDRKNHNEFRCREKNCNGIITQNQIIGMIEQK